MDYMMTGDSNVHEVDQITRFEVIDSDGRVYVNMNVDKIILMKQDGGKTLKVFVENQRE
jgi:hypothetical protein